MSPAATKSESDSRDALLDTADRCFYPAGIGAVTMADIRDQSGVSMRRIYSLYPTKADLVSAWLDHRHLQWVAWFQREIDTRSRAGSSELDSVFDALAEWLTSTEFRGCGFINTLAETGEVTNDHRRIIRDHKQALVDLLAAHGPDPAALAVLVDGAIVQATVFQSVEPIDAARRAAHLVNRTDNGA